MIEGNRRNPTRTLPATVAHDNGGRPRAIPGPSRPQPPGASRDGTRTYPRSENAPSGDTPPRPAGPALPRTAGPAAFRIRTRPPRSRTPCRAGAGGTPGSPIDVTADAVRAAISRQRRNSGSSATVWSAGTAATGSSLESARTRAATTTAAPVLRRDGSRRMSAGESSGSSLRIASP